MMRRDASGAASNPSPLLCYVTDRRALADPSGLALQITRAAAAGIDWIQIREKDLATHELLDLAGAAVKNAAELRGAHARIIVNDRLDVAFAASAAGVHLGKSSLSVAAVAAWRRGAPSSEFLIGASCHSPESAIAAESDGADYIFFGPVFITPSKAAYGAPQGIERLAEVAGKVRIPVLAIGGITAENTDECLAAGAAGIAAIRMFQEARDLPALVTRLRRAGKTKSGTP
jgi:thiamine-phosphate pyrophosphorylase